MRLVSASIRHILITAALLAFGVAAAISVVSVRRAISASGLPYPAADRLVALRAGGPSWSPAMLEALISTSTVFDDVAGVQERAATLVGDVAEIVRLESVSAPYFALLGAPPALGRVFTASEDRRNGASAVAVISDRLWRRRFGASSSAIGQRLDLDGHTIEIVGVMPRRFAGLIGRTDVWTPLGSARWLTGDTGPERPSSRWFEVIGRRRASLSVEAAAALYASQTPETIRQLPGGDRLLGTNPRFALIPLAEARIPASFPAVARALTIAVVALLALVVAGLTGLQLVRLDDRRRELAIRISLGATTGQLTRMAAREMALAAGIGVAGALWLRPYFLAALAAIQPASTAFGIVTAETLTPHVFGIDASTIAIAVAIAIAGTLPALIGTVLRARRSDLEGALRQRMGRSGLRGWRGLRVALLAVEAGLACVVISGGALLARSADAVFSRDRGYEIGSVVTARLDLPERYDADGAAVFYDEIVARLGAVPGITSASVSSCAPGGGRCRRTNISAVDGRPIEPAAQPTVGVNYATPAHFTTIGASVVRGRGIGGADRRGAPLVVVVSEPLAARLWPGESPLGRTIEIYTANGSLAGTRTVVGTFRPMTFGVEPDAGLDLFLPAAQAAWTSGVVFAKGAAPAPELVKTISTIVTALDRRVPVRDSGSLEAPLAKSLSAESFLRDTLLAFGIGGLLLAGVIMYAVVSRAVARHRREVGIRVALGATPRRIAMLAGRQGVAVAVVAITAGTIAQAWTSRLLTTFLHGLPPADLLSAIAGPVLTAGVVLAAVAIPSVRASRVDPMNVLRNDR